LCMCMWVCYLEWSQPSEYVEHQHCVGIEE
jgi:hypothetical protein